MKLYHDPISTTSRPVLLFLAEHDLAVEPVIVSLMGGEHLTNDFAAINPNQAVPVLVDGDFALTECSAILKYLADLCSSPAYPDDLKPRAQVNAMMDWFNTGFSTEFNHGYVYPQIFPHYVYENPAVQAETLARQIGRASKRLKVLDESILGDRRPFVCGDEITLADYLGAIYLGQGEAVEFDISRWPNVARWMDRMRARPSWGQANAGFYGLIAWAREQRNQPAA